MWYKYIKQILTKLIQLSKLNSTYKVPLIAGKVDIRRISTFKQDCK